MYLGPLSNPQVENTYLDCQCDNFTHSIRFVYDPEHGELQVETHLVNYLPWYKRVWLAVKYLFKATHSGLHQYDCSIIKPGDYPRLRAILEKAEGYEQKFAVIEHKL